MSEAVFPPCCLTWDQTIVKVMKIMSTSLEGPTHALLHSVPPTLQLATTDSELHWRLLDTRRKVWVSLLWGYCYFLLGPGAYKAFFVSSKSLFPQSCVSSGGSVVQLMMTSSKRAYATPRSASPRAPAPTSSHCWPIPPQETLKHSE